MGDGFGKGCPKVMNNLTPFYTDPFYDHFEGWP